MAKRTWTTRRWGPKRLRSDLREALDALRKAKKQARPQSEDGGRTKILKTIRDERVVFVLRLVARQHLGTGMPIDIHDQVGLLKHVIEAQSIIATMFEMEAMMLFEEAEDLIVEAIENVSEALEIALGLPG